MENYIVLIDGDEKRIRIDKNGYQVVKNTGEYVHRLVAEKALGRRLTSKEVVHHINGNPSDNTPANLLICTQKYHMNLHARERCIKEGYDPKEFIRCSGCNTYHRKTEFSTTNSHWSGYHPTCRAYTNKYRKERGMNTNKFNWKARLSQQYRRVLKSNGEISWLK